jgi:hypothetical protein
MVGPQGRGHPPTGPFAVGILGVNSSKQKGPR